MAPMVYNGPARPVPSLAICNLQWVIKAMEKCASAMLHGTWHAEIDPTPKRCICASFSNGFTVHHRPAYQLKLYRLDKRLWYQPHQTAIYLSVLRSIESPGRLDGHHVVRIPLASFTHAWFEKTAVCQPLVSHVNFPHYAYFWNCNHLCKHLHNA